jgi:transcriptional regulator with XRE-family HTH domain
MIRMAREAKGMTLRMLGEAAGVSAPFLSDVEHERRAPGKSLPRIAKALGVPLASLLVARIRRSAKELQRNNPEVAKLLRGLGAHCPCCVRYGAKP